MTGYISPFASHLRQKQHQSEEIARLVKEFEARGGKIQRFSQGDKSSEEDRHRGMRTYPTKRSPR